MSASWAVVLLVGVATVAIKGLGPVVLGGRPLPPRLLGALGLLAPALLSALIVTSVASSGRHLRLDGPSATALVVAAVALRLRVPVLGVVVLAAATAALLRAV